MVEKQRDESGQFSSEVTDDDILAAVRAHEPAATSEVAGEVGMSRQGTDRRLRRLRDSGRVSSKKIAASLVWFDAQGDETDAPAVGGDRRGEHAAPGSDDVDQDSDELDVEATVERVFENVDGPIDLPGSGAKLDERRDALRAAVAYLVENGSASRSDFKNDVYPDHSARYETPNSWWKNAIQPGLGDVDDEVNAIEGADHSGERRFVGFDT